ncbi:MAG TPA: helical backbone metal receptor [Salinimicrobium sp.]|nr:helical backbone metal receptor [Salinimicrobium sp.]
MIFTDQTNREIRLFNTPNRIVSLVPSQTELLVNLGLEEKIVGVTKFCVHPKNLRKEKKVVGGTKKIHFDKVRELCPDVILCNKEENTKEMVRELKKIAPVHVSDIKTIAGALEMIAQYGEMFGVTETASEIIDKIQRELDEFRSSIKERPKRKVAYFIWKNPWMVAGRGTFIDHLLELNHFKNIFTDENSRYPETTLEDIE